MRWDEMSMSQKSEAIGLMVRNGVTDIGTMKQMWDDMDGRKKKKPSYAEWVKGVNPLFVGPDYNLKAAYDELPFETMEAWRRDPNANHLPDTYKLPSHPTFSLESKDPVTGMKGGAWLGDRFYPSQANRLFNPDIYPHSGAYMELPYGYMVPETIQLPKPKLSFAEGGFTSPSYPPFNNTPQRTDIYDNEKRARGKWHVENAKGNPSSVITKAFNEAKSKGFNDNQAYEYVFDVASSKGWAKEGSVIQERTIPYKATINNIQDNTYVAKRPQIVPIQPKFVDYDKHQEEDLRYKAEEQEKELQARKDIATAASLAGAAMADKNPILGAMMQIPDIYMDWRYGKYPTTETAFNAFLEAMAIADNSVIGDKVENVLFKVPKFGKYLGGGYHLFRGLNDYGIPVGVTNDAIDLLTGKSGIEHIGVMLEDSDEVAANMLRTNIAKSNISFAEGGSIDDPPDKKPVIPVGGYMPDYYPSQQEWLRNWFRNREEQVNDNFNGIALGVNGFDTSRSIPVQYVEMAIDGSMKVPVKYQSIFNDPNNPTSAYNRDTGQIFIDPNMQDIESTLLHERTHALNHQLPQRVVGQQGYEMSPIESKVRDVMMPWYKENKQDLDEYWDDPVEIYARMMQMRYRLNLDPTKKVTKDDLKKWRKDGLLRQYEMGVYDDDTLLQLFNEVADNRQLQNNQQNTYVIPTDIGLGYV